MTALRHGRYLLLVLHLSGCAYSWRPVTASPRQFIEEEQPEVIRVWRDEEAAELREPRIEGDILTSTVPTEPPSRIGLSDITLIEAKRVSGEKTFLQWSLVGAGLTGIVLLMLQQRDEIVEEIISFPRAR